MRALHNYMFEAAGAVAVCCTAVPAQADQIAKYSFSLPAQELSLSIRQVAVRASINILAPAELVEGRTAPPVDGNFTAEEALVYLLDGSELNVERKGNTLLVVKHMAKGSDGGNEIVVTGSHLRGGQPTSPIISIDRKAIERSGATSVEGLFRQLPQNSNSGVSQENFDAPGAGADITEHGAGINLRGLGQRATLVLVNGRRLAPSGVGSFVDVSMIPVSAIERVEILTDGASAIYGSDAVGGVVNFILRDRFEGFETFVRAGTTTRGGGDQVLAGASAGHDWASGRVLVSYEFRREGPVRAEDRPFTINLAPDHSILPRERRHSLYGRFGQSLAEGLELGLSGTFSRRDTNRSYFRASSLLPINAEAEARSLGLGLSLGYDISSRWRAELNADHFRSRTKEVQAGENGLVNHLDTSNAVGDVTFKISGDLLDLPGGAVKVAGGGSIRREKFNNLFETAVNAPTSQPARRRVRSTFGEIQLPIFSTTNRQPGFERLVLTAAGRLDDYEGLKPSFDPKVGLLWSPLRGLNLRASYGSSFRAPLLWETGGFYNGFLLAERNFYTDAAKAGDGVGLALVGSNPNVRPESSKSWTVGGEIRPNAIPGLELDLNYYRVRFSDRIALATNHIAVADNLALAPIVTLNPSVQLVTLLLDGAAQVLDFSGPGFTNGHATPADVVVIVDARINNTAISTTSGIDALAQYRFNAGDHQFHLELNANHVLFFRDQLTGASPLVNVLDTPYHPLDWRFRGGLSWSYKGLSASMFINHAGAYRDNRRLTEKEVDSFTTLDAFLAYDLGVGRASGPLKDLQVGVSALNLLDARPPHLDVDPGLTRGLGYDPVNANGRGRFLSVQLRKRW